MAFVEPTPPSLRARFPIFTGVADEVIQEAIDEAGRRVDQTWPEGDYTLAKMLYAAHVMTMDGLGSGQEAQGILSDGFNVKRKKANLSEIEYAGSVSTGAAVTSGSTLGLTTFGIRFMEMQRRNFGGPVVSGGGGFPLSPNATDWPC